jgi:hypothetical protein
MVNSFQGLRVVAQAWPCLLGHPLVTVSRCFLVASPPVRDLLLCAKHLFVAAIADGDAARLQQCDLRRRCGSKKLSAEATNSPKK